MDNTPSREVIAAGDDGYATLLADLRRIIAAAARPRPSPPK